MLTLLLTAGVSLALIILSVFTYRSEASSIQKSLFLTFTLGVSLYLFALILSNTQYNPFFDNITNRLVFGLVPVFSVQLALFIRSIYRDVTKNFAITIVFMLLVFLLGISEHVVANINYVVTENVYAVTYGNYYPLFVFLAIAPIIYSLADAVRALKNLEGVTKTRLQLLLSSTAVTTALIVVTNVAFPIFFNIRSLSALALLWLSLWTIIMYYIIARYRLFDIKYLGGKALLSLLNALVVYILFFIAYFLQISLWGSLRNPAALFTGLLLALSVVGIINFTRKYFEIIIDNILDLGIKDRVELLEDYFQKTSETLELKKIIRLTKNICRKAFDNQFNEVYVLDSSHKSNQRTYKLLESIVPYINKLEVVLLEELINTTKFHKNLNPDQVSMINQLIESGAEVMISSRVNKEIYCVLLTGSKLSESAFGIEDLSFLQKVSTQLRPSVERALLHERVTTFNQTLKDEVKEATKELSQKYDELQEIRNKERDMMDIMGHELRTPLSIIKMTLAILKVRAKSKKFNGKVYEEYHNRLSDALVREVQLLEAMISSTKIDANRMDMHLTKVDLTKQINDSLYAQKSFIQEKGLEIKFNPDPEHQFIYADKTRIGEVLDNLIGNAVKYTEKGSIEISTETPSINMVKVNIKDSGIGIPKEALKKLGEKFFRVSTYLENKRKTDVNVVRPGGTGLGLYVSFGLIKIMGGSVEVASEYGKGSTFSFILPQYTGQKDLDQTQKEKNVFERLKISQQQKGTKLIAK